MRCATCDAEIDPKTLGGLCAVCLFDAGLPEETDHGGGTFRYDLIEEIARGGMGVVYRAVQHGSQRLVAVKMILAEQAATAGMMERFRAEAEAIASLEHPNILPVYETGDSDGRPFYSMKFVEGGTLRERIAHFRGRPREAAKLMALTARAVHHAHQRGILHRDLKPGNILLDGAELTPFVADFGIAKWLERENRLTLEPTALGTPHYISPEQAAGASGTLTTAADVYSLGAILYELLAGRPPFIGDTALETLRLVAQTLAAAPRHFDPSIPADLEVICLKCLAKEPGSRYSSAAALAEDLERWLEGRTIVARPARPPERLWRWAKRNPALAGVSAATIGLILALSIGSTIAAARLRVLNQRAVAAEKSAREEFRTASLAEAKATVRSGAMGQRFATLAALQRAGEVRIDPDLRTQAFAALMLPDLRVDRTWDDRYASNSPAALDSMQDRYVVEVAPGALSLRHVRDQKEIARLDAPPGNPRVLYIAPFSADDTKIAARFANDLVRVYDAPSGRILFDLADRPTASSGRAFAYDFGFTPDGRELAVAFPDGGVSFHDAADGRETGRLIAGTVPSAIALSPDGSKIALVGKQSGSVEIYDRAGGRLEQTLPHGDWVFHILWRPGDSHQLATSSRDNKVYLWDAGNGDQLHALQGHEGIPPLLAFHPGGKILASTSRDFSVRFWDVESGACVLNAHGVYGEPAMRFSRDGRALALGGEGTRLSTAQFAFDAPCREFFRCNSGDWYSRVSGMSVNGDGTTLAITLRSFGVYLFSTETGKRIGQLPLWPGESKTAVFIPGSDGLLVSGETAGLWEYPLDRLDKESLNFRDPRSIDSRPGFLVTDAKGAPPMAALSSAKSHRFSVVPLADATAAMNLPVKTVPATAHLSPDGQLVATDDWEGEIKDESDVRIWNAKTGELVRRLGAGSNNSVRISASGKFLVACGPGPGAGIWRLPELTRIENFEPRGEDAWFLPGDRLIGALNQGLLDIVRISDGVFIGSFPGDAALSVSFPPDGKKMFLGTSSRFYEWDIAATRSELGAIGLNWTD
jgi:WD40 repeat protein